MQATSTALACACNFLTTCAMAGVLAVGTLPKLVSDVRMDEGATTTSKLYQQVSRTRGAIGAVFWRTAERLSAVSGNQWLQNQGFLWSHHVNRSGS